MRWRFLGEQRNGELVSLVERNTHVGMYSQGEVRCCRGRSEADKFVEWNENILTNGYRDPRLAAVRRPRPGCVGTIKGHTGSISSVVPNKPTELSPAESLSGVRSCVETGAETTPWHSTNLEDEKGEH